MLELTLLGTPGVTANGVMVKLPTRKALLLLAYVALEGETSRGRLAELLWPDGEARAARRNLRAEVYRLSRTAVAAYLRVTDAFVAPRGKWRVDALSTEEVDVASLLEGDVPEGAFEEWLRGTRARLQAAARRSLTARRAALEASGDLRGAKEAAALLVRLDELDEGAWRDLVRLNVLVRDERGAREAFESFARVLDREFGAPPDETARRWLDSLRFPTSGGSVTLQAPLVGREDAWRTLHGAAGPLLLLGEPGVGKSRLAQEFSERHSPRLVLRGLPEARTWPLGALRVSLRTARDHGLLESAGVDMRALLARLLVHGANDTTLSFDASSDQKRRLFELLSKALVHTLRGGTLVLDDLHDFDDLSLEALRSALAEVARAPHSSRPRVVMTARAPELRANDVASAFTTDLLTRGAMHSVHLHGLTPTQVLEVVRATTGTTLGTRFADRLHEATGGNPLFVLETLRHLNDRGDVTVDDRGVWHIRFDETTSDCSELALPTSVLDTVRARVGALGENARRVLDVLAVLGRAAPLALVEIVTKLGPWQVEDVVVAATSAGFVRTPRGEVELAHDLHRVALLGGLDVVRRVLLHRELASALAASNSDATEVAHHFILAGDAPRAAEWLVRAAREAMAAYAWPEADAFVERALTLDPTGSVRGQALSLSAELRSLLGDLDGAARQLDALRRLADELRDEALHLDADVHLARLSYDAGDHESVMRITERLVDTSRPMEVRARGHLWRGLSLVRLGRMIDAREHLTASLHLEPKQRTRWTFNVHWALTQIHLAGGRFEEARAHALQARDTARVLGDPLLRAQGATLLGGVGLAQGLPDEARRALLEAYRFARELEHPKLRASIALNLGAASLQARRFAEAARVLEGALKETAALPDLHEVTRSNLAAAHFMLGKVGAAVEGLGDVTARARARGASLDLARRLLSLTNVRVTCGDAHVTPLLAEARELVTTLDLTILRHFLSSLDLARALLSGDTHDIAELHARLVALEDDVQGDETERHHLLLAEAHLTLGQRHEACGRLLRAPLGAWRARLELLTLERPDIRAARTWLEQPAVPAVEAALLAVTLARHTASPEDRRIARRRASALVRSTNDPALRTALEVRLAL